MILFLIYCIIGLADGIWATFMHWNLHPKYRQWYRLLSVFVINFILWPISLPLGIADIKRRKHPKITSRLL